MADNGKVLLIFPPTWDVSLPYLAIPLLVAYLRAQKIPVSAIDANLNSFRYLVAPQRLDALGGIIARRAAAIDGSSSRFDRVSLRRAQSLFAYLRRSCGAAGYLLSAADGVDIGRFERANRVLHAWMSLYSIIHHPQEFSLYSFPNLHRDFSPAGIQRFAAKEDHPLRAYVHGELLPQIQRQAPRIIGFSVISLEQMLHALYLARTIKQHVPGTYTVFGGCYLSLIRRKISSQLHTLRPWVDAVVFNEGEKALVNLQQLVTGARKARHPNLVLLHPELASPRGELPAVEAALTPEDYPCPDFSDLALDHYLAPARMLPILMTRGCYYGKCAFCNSKHATTREFSAMSAQRIAQDIHTLHRTYACDIFHINDEALHIPLFAKVGREIASLKLSFFAEARFERFIDKQWLQRIHRAGIKKIAFGFESANPRVLKLMRKGYEPRTARRILRLCHQQGITPHLFGIVGFPTETPAEMRDSFSFIQDLAFLKENPFFSYFFHPFLLEYGSRIFFHPRDYGIEEIKPTGLFDFVYDYAPGRPDSRKLDELLTRFRQSFEADRPHGFGFSFYSDLFFMHHLGTEGFIQALRQYRAQRDYSRFQLLPAEGEFPATLYDAGTNLMSLLQPWEYSLLSQFLAEQPADVTDYIRTSGMPKHLVNQCLRRLHIHAS